MSWDIVLKENKLTDVTEATIELSYYEEEFYNKVTGKNLEKWHNKKVTGIVDEVKSDLGLFLGKEAYQTCMEKTWYDDEHYKGVLTMLSYMVLKCNINPNAIVRYSDEGNGEILLTERKYADVEVADIGNYTYNVSGMYMESMGSSMSDFHDMKAHEAIATLKIGVEDMKNNPEKYKLMNPPNGWGDYEGALDYLERLKDGCEKHPNSTIKVS